MSTPARHRALVLDSIEDGFHVKTVPTPTPDLGSAIIRIDTVGVLSYHREVYNGERHYSFPKPLIGGLNAIGHVASLAADATTLQCGQLVYVDCVIHGRDNPDVVFLSAIHDGDSDGSKKLMQEVWRDGTFAEYAKVPLENCIPLDKATLCHSLGYSTQELMYIGHLLVPFGGLRDINIEPGETVLIAPATGTYGGAGVQVAIAMGARVIAMGRNEKELARLKDHVLRGSPNANIHTLKMTQDETTDAVALQELGPLDAVLDFTPPHGSESPHLRSAIKALRRGGRISIMGFNKNPMVPWIFVAKDISMKGKLMYDRSDIVQFIKMLQAGLFPRDKNFVDAKTFKLEEWKEAFDVAAEHTGIGKLVSLIP
ncbi:chaperonin 10-like protein [Talaromyces proteolyticus]|uniref:Chaperonin 10-like protein n=1 Tax=Talaromyces proteolyticus TaxID=1131652 RepID=A0AAD4L1P0_9EURO|nr:chaperonin 10-like protein [Talaromyces proteolyticus]KAH8702476.1 chaperonin 10-like protein [Talaromyces proteolyticus]